MNKMLLLLISMLLLSITITHAQQVIYVKVAATGNNNGSSWTGGFTQFQARVNACVPGDSFFLLRVFITPLPAGSGPRLGLGPFRCAEA